MVNLFEAQALYFILESNNGNEQENPGIRRIGKPGTV